MAYDGYASLIIMSLPITVMGYLLGGLFFGRYLRRAGTNTVAEYFGRRFSSRRIRVLAGVIVMLGLGGYLMTVTMGAALILSQVTDLSYVGALIVVWIAYSAFTFYAGSQGVVITDTIMFLFFSIVGLVALSFIVSAAGGWYAAIDGLATFEPRPGILAASSFTGADARWSTPAEAWTWCLIFSVSWGIVFAISPWQSSRYLMARDEHVVIRSACITACVLGFLWMVVYFSGAAIALSNSTIEPSADAMIWAALNLMPTIAGAILLAGILAAGLSSASTFLTLTGFAITNDVMKESSLSDARRLSLTRMTILGVGFVALSIAIVAPPEIFWITNFVAWIFAACWGPVAFLSVWSKNVTEAGAFWGMAVGILSCSILKLLTVLDVVTLPVYLDPILVAAAVSFVTIIVVSRFGIVREEEREYRKMLHVAPPELADQDQIRRTMIWPKALFMLGVVYAIGMLVFYARPYQLAVGLVSADGPYLVWSGELGLALGFGGLFMCGGLFAHWAISRFYASGI
jgi:sodium/pantothenate symporter